jgi:hypothetical protein
MGEGSEDRVGSIEMVAPEPGKSQYHDCDELVNRTTEEGKDMDVRPTGWVEGM